jgi:serine/threonine protein phosphatase PrpC
MSAEPTAARLACPSCGNSVAAQDSFCEACGRELPLAARGAAAGSAGGGAVAASPAGAGSAAAGSLAAGPPLTCPSCSATVVSAEGYCDSCGRRVPASRDHQELDLWLLAGVSDRGLRHRRNEDAMALATTDRGGSPVAVAVVSDGISTSDRPDEASLAAAEAALSVLRQAARAGGDLAEGCTAAVAAASAAVADLAGDPAEQPEIDEPSATLLAAIVTADAVTVCWLGDSRAYWLAEPAGRAQRLTVDDSLAQEMVTAGLLAESEAMRSPHAHVVTRWLGGDGPESAPHVSRFEPDGPGVVLLCSDGLWNYRPDAADLAGLAMPGALTEPLEAAAALVQVAIEAGGGDNITAVLIPFPPSYPVPSAPSAPSVATARLGRAAHAARAAHPPTVPVRISPPTVPAPVRIEPPTA